MSARAGGGRDPQLRGGEPAAAAGAGRRASPLPRLRQAALPGRRTARPLRERALPAAAMPRVIPPAAPPRAPPPHAPHLPPPLPPADPPARSDCKLLDTPDERRFDAITNLIKEMFHVSELWEGGGWA